MVERHYQRLRVENRRKKMSVEENKALARRFFAPPPEVIQKLKEGQNSRESMVKIFKTVIEEVFAPDCLVHYPEYDTNREGQLEYLLSAYRPFQNVNTTIEHIVAEGDMVAIHRRSSFTHSSVDKGGSAAVQKTEVKIISLWRIANGKVAEGWVW
jgi:predicted ester cyclase